MTKDYRVPCSWCTKPFLRDQLVDQDDGTLLCVGCVERRARAAQWERQHPTARRAYSMAPQKGKGDFASANVVSVKAGDTVTFHGPDGDVEATLVRFTGIGANLQIGDAELRDVRRGPNEGQWEPVSF